MGGRLRKMVSDAESLLRENLKVALQDARNLYDDGLLDEKEFKDLKAHELGKYKEQLTAVTAKCISRAAESMPAEPPSAKKMVPVTTPIRTPMTSRLRVEALRPSPASTGSPTSPPTVLGDRQKRGKEEVVYVDASTYKRLTTPPIFRRRSKNKRKIVLPCGELQALQGIREENANSK